jgi:hypothetical protein
LVRGSAAALIVALCTVALPALAEPDTTPSFDASRLAWRTANLSASKFFVSMTVSLDVEELDASRAEALLRAPPLVAPDRGEAGYVALRYVTDGLGRRSDVELLVDAASGAALQRTSLEAGNRNKHRIYRLRETDVLRITNRPQENEETLRYTDWTRHSEEIYAYPDRRPYPVVTEAGALIYLAAASSLSVPGDSFRLLALASDEFHEVEVMMAGDNAIGVEYTMVSTQGQIRRDEKIPALRYFIRGRPLSQEEGGEFRLLGLSDIELFLDPETRAPLQLRGRVDVFGRVKFQLDSLTLKD